MIPASLAHVHKCRDAITRVMVVVYFSIGCDNGVASAALPSGLPSLTLSVQRTIAAPVGTRLVGVSFAASGQVLGWSADGKVFVEHNGSFRVDTQLPVGSWDLRDIALNLDQHAIGLVSRDDEIGVVHTSAGARPVRLAFGSFLASARVASHWDLLIADREDRLVYSRFDTAGQAVRRLVIESATSPRWLRPHSLATGRAGTMIATTTRDSLRLTCIDADSVFARTSTHASEFVGASPSAEREAAWAVSATLAVSDVFLVALSDLRSRNRTVVIADSSCRVMRATQLPDLVVPLVASTTSQHILAADFRGGTRFVLFDWRWGARH
jgi:hypothetical protein